MQILPRSIQAILASAALAIALAPALAGQDQPPLFAPAEPASVGLDAESLEALAKVVQGFVDSGAIVGAELAVIKNDRLAFDRAFGWKHREEGVRMSPGAIYCVRSMTKPVVGTAVQMLIDEKKLSLSDRASKYLPSFDNDRSRKITVEQLLTHYGGLPLSGLLGKDVSKLTGIREVADAAGEKGPEFPPGERFNYSDDGTDTLGALVEIASGKSLEEFLSERIFTPLEMRETIAVVKKDHPLRERVASAYAGSAGQWTRFFGPTSDPIFGTLLASQGLYCSVLDYARFLHLWKENGVAGSTRLLSARAMRRALEPGRPMAYPTSFDGTEAQYGHLLQLWVEKEADAKKKPPLYAFGHGGSDGTHAWVFPELDLMVFYFTQSRGNTTGIEIEREIQKHIVDPLLGEKRAPPLSYSDAELDAFVGLYSPDGEEIFAIVRRKDGLAAEFPAEGIVDLGPTKKQDSFDFKMAAGMGVDFERSETGAVEVAIKRAGRAPERAPRFVPSADVISVDALMELRRRGVDWTKIDAAGTMRWKSKLAMPTQKLEADVVTHARGLDQFKSEIDLKTRKASATLDGEHGWSWSSIGELEELEGERLEALRFEHPLVPIADWRALYADLRVLYKGDWKGSPAWLVRATPRTGTAQMWFVSAETGLPLALLAIGPIPGVGELGVLTTYEDWRDVGPIRLPFRRMGKYASPLLGKFTVEVAAIEANVDAPPNVFSVDVERAATK